MASKTWRRAALLHHHVAEAAPAEQMASSTWLAPDTAPVIPKGPMQPSTVYGRFARRTFTRQWEAFMSARIVLALAILGLHASANTAIQALPVWAFGTAVVYTVLTLVELVFMHAPRPGQSFDSQWLYTTGIDLLYFCVLRAQSVAAVDYTPFLVFPVFMAAILGSRTLALCTAVLAAAAQFYATILESQGALWSHAAQLGQAAIVGVGLIALGWVTNFLAARLIREQIRSERSAAESKTQTLVNKLVVETLGEGILVVDDQNSVHAANPAARNILELQDPMIPSAFNLTAATAWGPLVEIAQRTFTAGPVSPAETVVLEDERRSVQVQVRTERTPASDDGSTGLCVMFLRDQRELEARIRTEKLASMGRVSAAVAHEFRNPLATINQANSLLGEELVAPEHVRLSAMIAQNVQRLTHTVEDILDVARVQGSTRDVAPLAIDEQTQTFCGEWVRQHPGNGRVRVLLGASDALIRFSSDHLRRLIVNLLDNAARYASLRADAIQVTTHSAGPGFVVLSIWSDGKPIDASLQRHLFEPFFSSESRSSGLGLFLCRQLCEQYGARIEYRASTRRQREASIRGNEFLLRFQRIEVPGRVSRQIPTQ